MLSLDDNTSKSHILQQDIDFEPSARYSDYQDQSYNYS